MVRFECDTSSSILFVLIIIKFNFWYKFTKFWKSVSSHLEKLLQDVCIYGHVYHMDCWHKSLAFLWLHKFLMKELSFVKNSWDRVFEFLGFVLNPKNRALMLCKILIEWIFADVNKGCNDGGCNRIPEASSWFLWRRGYIDLAAFVLGECFLIFLGMIFRAWIFSSWDHRNT